jgi:hypothetical protein
MIPIVARGLAAFAGLRGCTVVAILGSISTGRRSRFTARFGSLSAIITAILACGLGAFTGRCRCTVGAVLSSISISGGCRITAWCCSLITAITGGGRLAPGGNWRAAVTCLSATSVWSGSWISTRWHCSLSPLVAAISSRGWSAFVCGVWCSLRSTCTSAVTSGDCRAVARD